MGANVRKIFGEYGFHGTTTRMIAKDVGIDISTLYYHWGEKQDLYEAVLEDVGDGVGRGPPVLIRGDLLQQRLVMLGRPFRGDAERPLTELLAALPPDAGLSALQPLLGQVFNSDVAFREAVTAAIGNEAFSTHQSALVSNAISMNPKLILVGILGFVAGFAISLGPVMWVLFSELFPNRVRGIAISFVGLINSGVSFLVQLVFPWELENLGNSTTFLIYGVFAVIGLIIILKLLPETKGKSLEELEAELVRS